MLKDPERVQNSKMIQEILIPIVLKIQRAIRFWIYRRKYLPYLQIKRQRDKQEIDKLLLHHRVQVQYQPLVVFETYKLRQTIGYHNNLVMMPKYFKDLQSQASKQLHEEDIKSIIKSRHICETKLERASDQFRSSIVGTSIAFRTEQLIKQFYD